MCFAISTIELCHRNTNNSFGFQQNSVFYQIPSSRIVSLGAVHSYSSFDGQDRSGDFLDPEPLNHILSDYKLDEDDNSDLMSDKFTQSKDTP